MARPTMVGCGGAQKAGRAARGSRRLEMVCKAWQARRPSAMNGWPSVPRQSRLGWVWAKRRVKAWQAWPGQHGHGHYGGFELGRNGVEVSGWTWHRGQARRTGSRKARQARYSEVEPGQDKRGLEGMAGKAIMGEVRFFAA